MPGWLPFGVGGFLSESLVDRVSVVFLGYPDWILPSVIDHLVGWLGGFCIGFLGV